MARGEAEGVKVRKRDADRTRGAILRAAAREFSVNGFSGARTERITRQAKCNIRMLYHHFGNKKSLYIAVIEMAYEDLREKEAALVFDLTDPVGCVEALYRFTFRYFEQNPYFEGLLRAENMMLGRFVRQSSSVPEAAERLRHTLETIIAAGEELRAFRAGIDPVQLYVTITALSRFHLANGYTLSALLRTDLRSAEWRAARLEHGAELLRSYLQAATPASPIIDSSPNQMARNSSRSLA